MWRIFLMYFLPIARSIAYSSPHFLSSLPFSLPSFLSENFPEVARMGMSDEEEEEGV